MSNISPKIDIAFKKIFGVEENKDLLISLINSIVSEQDQVADVTLLNPYNPKNFRQDKLSILDIKAKSIDGKMFNIEIQINDDADYDKRALYYWAKLYTEQLKNADDYSSLSKAIGIHILHFTSIPDVEKYHNVFHITEKDSGVMYFKDLELHTIELKKFAKDFKEELSDMVAKVKSKLDMWAAFLTRNDLLQADALPQKLNDAALKKAINVLDVMQFSPEEREAYDGHLKWLRMEASALKKAEEKGEARGVVKGIAKGIAKGRAEEKLEIARNLLKAGVETELITKITGLTKEDIKAK